MKLVIVESPAKAKTIEKYLGKGYEVRASVGHIRDLPKSNKDAVDIEGGFVPRYRVVPEKERVIHDLERAAKKADEVILATDPDREGEAIAWHVSDTIGLNKPKRIVFNEITERAVQEALQHPRAVDMQLVKAQEARRVLDRLFGYDLSGLIWKKVRYGLSAGRVQSPALRILMEREREIRAFVPEAFWVLEAELETSRKERFVATCVEEPKSAEEAERIVAEARAGQWRVVSVDESEQSRSPRAPFTTSTLQQTASTRLGYSPSRTMRIAQKLYEAGHITYMRTDSPTLSREALTQLARVVSSEYGAEMLSTRQYKSRSKSVQEAHEAVRPTDASKRSLGSTDEQKKLYALIRARSLASQMADAKILRTKIVANTEGSPIPDFSATGSRVVFEGWLKADPAARGEDVELPKANPEEELTLVEARSEEKATQPPSRYSEAGLVKELEKRGIGRPSTYASIIKTLEDRGYVEKQGRTLIPTHTGDVVSSFIEDHFADYISDTFTAEMENELDDIASGTREYEKTLHAFYAPFAKAVKGKEKIEKLTNMGDAPEEFPCPLCGAPMVYKLSRSGRFMSCSNFPTCLGARKEDGSIIEPPKDLGEPCPECKDGKLIEREGRFGRFVACSNYPKCKYVRRDENSQNSTGVACLSCGKGQLVEKRGRFGPFFACSNYPECKFTMKARPTGNICKDCGKLMMEGTKTIPERCSDKSCANHNPHKK
ncbi:type I DNA topoisomerase [Candidatus Kaiserbacteria bacterium CG10_big_fil_rev_8_21_14_0_10_59_10]|uniref:DNA topoisomerase 1 n=1 Tax=Candidatus Kaiserbacteria bacterium CG10_big_fil_rev_8_21_14_0_10_59_10 TaxID=1974612 RepID=A0A2H0U6X6_9BACT|nr:MAG: type I DNA topoisomerase [Candidatus Kaiserbacteria bacterium CG10_big_fil_rev_8_21_14_0_10_59_10]